MKKSTLLIYSIFIIITLNIVMYLTQWGGEKVLLYVSDLLPVICSFISVICLITVFRSFKVADFTKNTWLFILTGILLYFVAESTYACLEIVEEYDMNETFPTIADLFWCAGYLPLFIGLFMMIVGYKKSGLPIGNIRKYLIFAVLILAVSSVVFYFVLLPVIQDPETTGLSKVIYLFYPIGDIVVVIPAVILMVITSMFGKGKISFPWRFLAIGFILFAIADLLYSYLSWEDQYGSGNLIDLAWNSGYLMIGLGGLYQKELIESVK